MGYSIEVHGHRATSIWKIMMNPHDIEMEDISNVFDETVSWVSNMRHFKSQQITLDHYEEEGEVNHVRCHTVGVNLDSNARDLEEQWLR